MNKFTAFCIKRKTLLQFITIAAMACTLMIANYLAGYHRAIKDGVKCTVIDTACVFLDHSEIKIDSERTETIAADTDEVDQEKCDTIREAGHFKWYGDCVLIPVYDTVFILKDEWGHVIHELNRACNK